MCSFVEIECMKATKIQEFDTWNQCLIAAHNESIELITSMPPDLVESKRIATKYTCTPSNSTPTWQGVALQPKTDIYSLMSSYRIQIRSDGKYYDGIIEAQDEVSALQQFEKKLTNGEIEAKDEPLYTPKRVFITYEELDNGTTKANIGEASAGVQVGRTSVATG